MQCAGVTTTKKVTCVTLCHAPAQRTGLGPRVTRFNRNRGSGDEAGEGGGFRVGYKLFIIDIALII